MSHRLCGAALAATLCLLVSCRFVQHETSSDLLIMTYNVQNLFDDQDDGTEYRDYDPGGGRWNTALYHEKLSRIAQVIVAAAPQGPDIVALQEIENVSVLRTLVETYLSDSGYREAVLVPTPGSPVHVGLLSKRPVTEVKSHGVAFLGSRHPLRDVLEVWIDIDGSDLVVLVNHWKSRSGGAEETEPMRRAAAGMVAGRLRRLAVTHPDAEVLVAGDLNVGLDEHERADGRYPVALVPDSATGSVDALAYTHRPEAVKVGPQAVVLFSPWQNSATPGSYVYRDRWETIDHFLLGPGLVDGEGLTFGEFRVVRERFMVAADGAPRRWIDDSGYSDHLPLLLTLTRSP